MTQSDSAGGTVAGEPLVVLDHVDKWFGDLHVLQDIELTIHRGEVVVVIGPSGSGKSTLCRTINRLETIDKGTISLDGQPLPAEGKELAKLRAEVGMVFQSFNLFAHKTILENVTLGPMKVRGVKKADAEKRGLELLDRVGIAHQAQKYPAQLSGGQQQRVALARALAMDPKVMLFDEPPSRPSADEVAAPCESGTSYQEEEDRIYSQDFSTDMDGDAQADGGGKKQKKKQQKTVFLMKLSWKICVVERPQLNYEMV